MYMNCNYCKRQSTRYYNNKHLCELHYYLENRQRNYTLVDWEKMGRLHLSKAEFMLLINLEQKPCS